MWLGPADPRSAPCELAAVAELDPALQILEQLKTSDRLPLPSDAAKVLRSPALPFFTTTSGLSFALEEQVWFSKRVWVPDETNIEASHCRIPHGTLFTTDFVLLGRWLPGRGAAPSRAQQHIRPLVELEVVWFTATPSLRAGTSARLPAASLPSAVDLQLTLRCQWRLQVNAAASTQNTSTFNECWEEGKHLCWYR